MLINMAKQIWTQHLIDEGGLNREHLNNPMKDAGRSRGQRLPPAGEVQGRPGLSAAESAQTNKHTS